MPLNIFKIDQSELEFQMFVLDELADVEIKKGRDIIKLTIGISELQPKKEIIEKFSSGNYNWEMMQKVYPQGYPALREAIANYYNKNFSTNVDARSILVSTGTSTIFRNLFHLIVKPKQKILLPKPFYSLYKFCSILSEAEITFYEINLDSGRINLKSFSDNYDPEQTACVVINNPGNPLGNFVSQDEILEMYSIVNGNSYIINDEIYNNTAFYDSFVCPLSYLSEKDKNITIVTNSFSKGFRMYTKRVGYAHLPDELIMPMRIIQQHTLLTHDPSSQYGMIEALNDKESPLELTKIYRERAEYGFKELFETKLKPFKALGGFYLTVDCEEIINSSNNKFIDSKDLAIDILEKVGVATVPGTDFGLENCLRISLCSSRFHEGIDRIKGYI